MSRRREAADLARALLLSTEDQDPSHPSSARSDPPSVMSSDVRSSITGPSRQDGGMLAARQGVGSGEGSSGSRMSEIGVFSESSGHPPLAESGIKSFTPSYHLPAKNILVPPSFTPPPIPRSSAIIPSSNLPRSSPLIPPLAKSSKSSNDTPSTGPLFSPTQTSALNALGASAPQVLERPAQAIIRTYGKTASNISPEKVTEPANPKTRISMLLSSSPKAPSSDEIQEEVELASRRDRASSKSRAAVAAMVEVLIPSRPVSAPVKRARTHSPDPLDSLVSESVESNGEIESLGGLFAPPPPASRASTSTNTQASKIEESGRRVSARVQQHREEEEKKKAERRRKRAEEKARLKEEEERRSKRAEREKEREKQASSVKLSREERSARRSEVAQLPKDVGAGQSKEKARASEVIEIHDDEESIVPIPKPRPLDLPNMKSKVLAEEVKRKEEKKDKGKKRKSRADEEPAAGSRSEKASEPVAVIAVAQEKAVAEPEISKLSPEKGKGKKRNRIVESEAEDNAPPAAAIVEVTKEREDEELGTPAEGQQEAEDVEEAEPALRPSKVPSPLGDLASNRSREPLRPIPPHVKSPAPSRASPGPNNAPGGIKWKTSRSDLSSVLSKFPGAKHTGMSRRHRIPSLHTKIGPPVKALPPPPPKPTRKKKGDSDDEDEDEEEEESDGEGGTRMVKRGKKEKGLEWFMQDVD